MATNNTNIPLPKTDELEHTLCAVCGSSEYHIISKIERNHLPLQTVMCATCGLVYTNPRPSEAWYNLFYEKYFRVYYGGKGYPTDETANSIESRHKHLSNIEFIRRHLKSKGDVLDIGSSEGNFLRYFGDAQPDWQLYGIEPNPKYADFSRKHFDLENITTGAFPEVLDRNKKFNLIHTGHVFEHILEPAQFLNDCYDALDKNGYLFLDVPNVECKAKGIHFLHIAHVYHYGISNIGAILNKYGFKILAHKDDLTGPPPKCKSPWTLQVLAQKTPKGDISFQYPHQDTKEMARKLKKQWQMPFKKKVRHWLKRK